MINYTFRSQRELVTFLLLSIPAFGTGWGLFAVFGWLTAHPLSLTYYLVTCLGLGLAVLGCVILYYLFCYFTLTYVLTQDYLMIKSGLTRYAIPLGDIQVKKHSKQGLWDFWENRWTRSGHKVQYLTSCFPLLRGTLSLQYRDMEFIINPRQQIVFLAAFYRIDKLRVLDTEKPADEKQVTFSRSKFLDNLQSWLPDRQYAGYILLNFFLLFILSGYVFWGIGIIPRYAVLHYTVLGGIELDGPKQFLLLFAVIGWVLFIVATIISKVLSRYERLAGYLLLGFFPFIQIALAVAMHGILEVTG
ncbi:MAG TPA: hypothetical protein PKL83_02645 [bacterium]|nr:hypothetical protein [bacterium]